MALVITRKPGTFFTIGDDIKITVVEIKGQQARIAIDAPKHLDIKRDDIINDKSKKV